MQALRIMVHRALGPGTMWSRRRAGMLAHCAVIAASRAQGRNGRLRVARHQCRVPSDGPLLISSGGRRLGAGTCGAWWWRAVVRLRGRRTQCAPPTHHHWPTDAFAARPRRGQLKYRERAVAGRVSAGRRRRRRRRRRESRGRPARRAAPARSLFAVRAGPRRCRRAAWWKRSFEGDKVGWGVAGC
jgi:hypothetical protein